MSWLFDTSSPMDEVMEKATAEHQTSENWELILHICDAIKSDTKFIKPAIISIKKRLNHRDPHVALLAVSVLDSCWANCGPAFRREISSKDFINELDSKCRSSVRQLGEKSRLMLKKWVDVEAKDDDSLGLVRSLKKNLMVEGYSFESSEPKKRVVISNDPNVVTSQEEEDAIAKAIAASLSDAPKENGGSGGNKASSALYPSAMNGGGASRMESAPRLEKRAFALYDFEAAEDNELSFKTGDDITITDDSNANWWRGRNERTRGEGLFPSSFVTTNPAEVAAQKTETTIAQSTQPAAVVRIDEEQLLKCIAMLEDCDPSGALSDPPELGQIEASSLAQAPLIDAALASVDRQSNALAMVDVAIRNVLALYDGAAMQAQYTPRYGAPLAGQMHAPPPSGGGVQQMHQQGGGGLGGHPQQMHNQYYAPPPSQPRSQQHMQHPQMQPQPQHPHYGAHPGQPQSAPVPPPVDWQQQQYMQQMQQAQQQQHQLQYAPPPPSQYPQYAPVGHPDAAQQQY